LLSKIFVEVNQHFGIAARSKAVTPATQFSPELQIVIDLAVANDTDSMVFIPNRLPAGFQVDDREPTHPERKVKLWGQILAFTIGTTMDHAIKHSPKRAIHIGSGRIYESGYATHFDASTKSVAIAGGS
jgi:hypothetical protein